MRLPPHPPPPPPPQPPRATLKTTPGGGLPDLVLTAFSLFLLFTSPKHLPLPPSLSFPLHPNTRRLSSAMPRNPNPNLNFGSVSFFPTPQSLSDWLKPRLPSDSFATWGIKPGTKNVHNLWLELTDGEISLVDSNPPVRNLEVVSIRVIDEKNRVLIESHQELSDGSIRDRGRPLSEKLKSGEDVDSAIKRAIKEELGSILCKIYGSEDVDFDKIVRVLSNSYNRSVEERVSVSYPGLPACYVMHTVDASVEGLPEGEFTTEEENEYRDCEETAILSEAVRVRRHFWKWVVPDSV